jgi:hypothetical protein
MLLLLLLLWRSISLRNTALLVIGLPVSPLAVSAAVKDKATARASRELVGSTCYPTRHKAIATRLVA